MRHKRTQIIAAMLLSVCGASLQAHGQTSRAPTTAPSPAAPPATPPGPAAVPAMPQQTTASFGDWVLRCTRTGPTAQICEVVQGISSQDRAVAQLAIGRPARGQPLQLTVLVPSNVTLASGPVLATSHDGEAPTLELAWRRCLPIGCVADAAMTEEALRRVRGWTEAGRVTFADGAGRTIALPFSPRGLPQALDALARGEAG